jgi:hypothetical protein
LDRDRAIGKEEERERIPARVLAKDPSEGVQKVDGGDVPAASRRRRDHDGLRSNVASSGA